jgi:hypothetical protein
LENQRIFRPSGKIVADERRLFVKSQFLKFDEGKLLE